MLTSSRVSMPPLQMPAPSSSRRDTTISLSSRPRTSAAGLRGGIEMFNRRILIEKLQHITASGFDASVTDGYAILQSA